MQVSVETTSGLQRRMTVTVPEDRIDEAVQTRLKNLARTVKIQGFRPGKVPFNVVKSRYAGQVRQEVVNELLQSSFVEAIGQEKLRPAGRPDIEPKVSGSGEGLQYTATFEVYPEFELAPLAGVTIEKPAADITEADIDGMLETIRKQHLVWEPVERAAADGDRVIMDFTGTLDGEPFQGNSGTNVPVVLGQGRMIQGFEEGLKGAKPGDELTLDLNFPEDYHAREVAGKPVRFAVKVRAVEASRLPEVDAALAKTLGVDGGMEELRSEVRANMQRELSQSLKSKIKQVVMDKLLEINKIDVPQALVEEESHHLAQQMLQGLAAQGAKLQDLKLDPANFAPQAARRVALGLILAEMVHSNKLSVDPGRLRAAVEEMAASYEHPEEVVKWYYSDRRRLSEVESMVLEEQVVDWVLAQADVAEKPQSFAEVMYPERAQEQS